MSHEMRFQPRHRFLPLSKHASARILGIAKYLIHPRQAKSGGPGSDDGNEVRARPRSSRQRFNQASGYRYRRQLGAIAEDRTSRHEINFTSKMITQFRHFSVIDIADRLDVKYPRALIDME
jgi:hypothetical protein